LGSIDAAIIKESAEISLMRKLGRKNKDRLRFLMVVSIKFENGLIYRKKDTLLNSESVSFHYIMDENDNSEVGIHIKDVKVFNALFSNENGELSHLRNSLKFFNLDCYISLVDEVLFEEILNSENWSNKQKEILKLRTFQISKSSINRELEEYTAI
jgi:hypothetical protein